MTLDSVRSAAGTTSAAKIAAQLAMHNEERIVAETAPTLCVSSVGAKLSKDQV